MRTCASRPRLRLAFLLASAGPEGCGPDAVDPGQVAPADDRGGRGGDGRHRRATGGAGDGGGGARARPGARGGAGRSGHAAVAARGGAGRGARARVGQRGQAVVRGRRRRPRRDAWRERRRRRRGPRWQRRGGARRDRGGSRRRGGQRRSTAARRAAPGRRRAGRQRGRRGGSGGALAPVTVWIAGDSTVANGSSPCPIGWGGPFPMLFGAQRHGHQQRCRRPQRAHLALQRADGHGRDGRVRPRHGRQRQPDAAVALAGDAERDVGDEGGRLPLHPVRHQRQRSATCDRHVGVDAFKISYGMMAQAAKDRGAHPIFVTPLSMIRCSGTHGHRQSRAVRDRDQGRGHAVRRPGDRSARARRSRSTTQHAFCPIPGGDVSATTTGPVGDFFCDDHTHLSPAGAVEIAGLVAKALRDQNIPLAAYLK